ncbi:hypothetical protein K402DRAFT_415955 [Aulographum hederae CBS 113979]|uniref:ABM domain-containing protein n=1 Tax=Aulographum hederae CBS 113979 TaxID=1176131 RepID=A0A6G1HH50_9PEZI|nr:hypothetical protein K402DRAFT_415955 [Aulographum hederae CBS 113979]
MAEIKAINETIIVRLKEGIELEDSATVAKTTKLAETMKAIDGVVRVFWGPQVEDPRHCVWIIYWKAQENFTAFGASEGFGPFSAMVAEIFDVVALPPIVFMTNFNSDATAGYTAPVTEIAFFTVPKSALEEARADIEASDVSSHPVFSVGNSSGGSIGFVFLAKHAENTAPEDRTVALHGVFGYESVDDHVKWRATPEHAQVIEEMGKSKLAELGMGESNVPGGNIFLPDSNMFHVKFQAA